MSRNSGCCEDMGLYFTGDRSRKSGGEGRTGALMGPKWLGSRVGWGTVGCEPVQ